MAREGAVRTEDFFQLLKFVAYYSDSIHDVWTSPNHLQDCPSQFWTAINQIHQELCQIFLAHLVHKHGLDYLRLRFHPYHLRAVWTPLFPYEAVPEKETVWSQVSDPSAPGRQRKST